MPGVKTGPCSLCHEKTPHDKLLLCDFEGCEAATCFSCARVTSPPEGDFFCNEHKAPGDTATTGPGTTTVPASTTKGSRTAPARPGLAADAARPDAAQPADNSSQPDATLGTTSAQLTKDFTENAAASGLAAPGPALQTPATGPPQPPTNVNLDGLEMDTANRPGKRGLRSSPGTPEDRPKRFHERRTPQGAEKRGPTDDNDDASVLPRRNLGAALNATDSGTSATSATLAATLDTRDSGALATSATAKTAPPAHDKQTQHFYLATAPSTPTRLQPLLPPAQLPDPNALHDATTNATLLHLVTNINGKLDALTTTTNHLSTNAATKQDLNHLHSTLTQETKTLVTNSLKPLQDNLGALTTQLNALTARTTALEQRPSTAGSSTDTALTNTLQRQQRALDKLDPARNSIVFIGFTDKYTAAQRRQLVNDHLQTHTPTLAHNTPEPLYTGKHDARRLSKVTAVQYHSYDEKTEALKTLKQHPLSLDGTELRVDHKKTTRQQQRNYSLKHAEELLKKHLLTTDKNAQEKKVTLNWKLTGSTTRNITINDVPAFTQLNTDLTGTFSPDFHSLTF